MKHEIRELIYTPIAYDWLWKPRLTKIVGIEDESYLVEYIHMTAYGRRDDLASKNEYEVFPPTKEGLEACKKYIKDYYYDGLCGGCKYEGMSGTIWTCGECKHRKSGECEYNGLSVGQFNEACFLFDPIYPQNSNGMDWYTYVDMLRNCDFNPECKFHKYSCHGTCEYNQYINQLVQVDVEKFGIRRDDRDVSYISVIRKDWMDGSFIGYWSNKSFIKWGRFKDVCGLRYKPIRDKHGNIKKGTANNGISFDKPEVVDYVNN